MKFLATILILIASLFWWLSEPSIKVNDQISYNYLVKYSGNASSDQNLPMLIALHGNGDTPKNFYETALDQINMPARIILIKAPIKYSSGTAWAMNVNDLAKHGPAISTAISILTDKFPTREKPVLLGFSGGAVMAYFQAVTSGAKFKKVFAVSGYMNEDLLDGRNTEFGTEVEAFHGINDNVIPYSQGVVAVNTLKTRHIPTTFTEFEGDHLGLFTSEKATISTLINQTLAE